MKLTTRPFERSHGKRPRGRGTWAFQASLSDVAFHDDLFDEIVFANGTLTEAFHIARQQFPARSQRTSAQE